MVPPTTPRAFAQNGDGLFVLLIAGIEQLFLGGAAIVPQRLKLEAVDLGALLRELIGHQPGQRQIDVVAAQQDVLAHRHAVEGQFAALLGDGDQREIGGAAADIDHQDQVARR